MARKYETAIRTGGRRSGYFGKKKSGGGFAAVLAIILVFAAGFLIGNSAPIPKLIDTEGGASSVPAAPASSQPEAPVSSGSAAFVLPEGLATAEPPTDPAAALQIGSIDAVSAPSYLVIDRLSGEVILERNSGDRIYPAETTMILSAALALQYGNADDALTVSATALGLIGRDSAKLGLLRDETVPLRDLLYATLLSSSCDAANVIADRLGGAGGFSGYVSDMVAMAKSLGCTGTYFVNPSGVHSSAHFSTAADLVRMEAFAHANPEYRKIVAADEYTMTATDLHTADGWATARNTNPVPELTGLLRDTNVAAVTGAKSGGSAQSGYSLVCTAATVGGRELIAVVAGIPYNGGNGAAFCVPDMAAVLAEAAKKADSADAAVVITAGESLSAALSGGVEAFVPQDMLLTADRSLALTVPTEGALTDGETPVFYAADGLAVTAVYYSDLEQRLTQASAGAEVTVGYLRVTAGNARPTDDIPLVLRRK